MSDVGMLGNGHDLTGGTGGAVRAVTEAAIQPVLGIPADRGFDIGPLAIRPTHRMRTEMSLVVRVIVLVALMLAVTPLAYSDPPEPTWIGGFWDEADFDNFVECITSASALLRAPITRELRPDPVIVVLKLSAIGDAITVVSLCASGPRSPPAA